MGQIILSKLTMVDFNVENYLKWSQSAKTALAGEKKLGYINGKIKQPQEDSLAYGDLGSSVEQSIVCSFIFSKAAKDMWTHIVKRKGKKMSSNSE